MRNVRVMRRLNMYSTWNRKKTTLSSGHYLRNRSTLDIAVLGYIGTVQHKEHSPEVLSIPPGTPCKTNHSAGVLLRKLTLSKWSSNAFIHSCK